MKRPPNAPPPEDYHLRLGVPRPGLSTLTGRQDLKLLDWLVAALLERGGPMAPEEVAERLEAVGVSAATGDLPLSLKRAAAPSPNVFRDEAGRLALDLGDPQDPDLRYRLLVLDLLERTERPEPEPAVAPPPPLPPDDEPLSWEEVEGAFRDSWMFTLSGTRQAAMVLDTAAGRPLTIDEIERRLAGLGGRRSRLNLERPYTWVRPPLRSRADGVLELDHGASQLPALRRLVREEGRKAGERREREAQATAFAAGAEERRRAENDAAREKASILRRVLLHLVPASGDPRAAVLLDPASRRIESFVGDELADLPRRLAPYDLVVGIDPRRALDRLGADPNAFRRADLDRPQKTLTLGPGRRLLRITNPLLVGATLGLRRPLADDATHRHQLAGGQVARLRRRLEREAELLWAYYRYGVLHRRVALRWGPLDEWLLVSWPLLGDPSLVDLMAEAEATGRRLEIVLGDPPSWDDPWSGSVLAEPRKVGRGGWLLRLFGGAHLDGTGDDIFEARLTDERPSLRRAPTR